MAKFSKFYVLFDFYLEHWQGGNIVNRHLLVLSTHVEDGNHQVPQKGNNHPEGPSEIPRWLCHRRFHCKKEHCHFESNTKTLNISLMTVSCMSVYSGNKPICNSNISVLSRFGREMPYGKNKQTYSNKQWENYLGTKSISSDLLYNLSSGPIYSTSKKVSWNNPLSPSLSRSPVQVFISGHHDGFPSSNPICTLSSVWLWCFYGNLQAPA